jgi:hypothetical protein
MKIIYHSPVQTPGVIALVVIIYLLFKFPEQSSAANLISSCILAFLVFAFVFGCHKVEVSEDSIFFSYPLGFVKSRKIQFATISLVECRQLESRISSANFVVTLKSKEKIKVSLETVFASVNDIYDVLRAKGIEVIER